MSTLNSTSFYNNYHGHRVEHLKIVKGELGQRPIVYLAGDSSLDSKHWFHQNNNAVNGYQNFLTPPLMKEDISYWLNRQFAENDDDYAVINTAVEESTLGERWNNGLNPQDQFIQNFIQKDDILFVSCGGNDIALKPSFGTIWNMMLLMAFENEESLGKNPSRIWGLKHFVYLFKDKMTHYLKQLTFRTKPKKIIVSMIYFPDQIPSGGWADNVLSKLSYYNNPKKLQAAIKAIFKHAVSQIQIDGIEVIPFPMFQYLDGTNTNLYCVGVEPSALGNRVLAEGVYPLITRPVRPQKSIKPQPKKMKSKLKGWL